MDFLLDYLNSVINFVTDKDNIDLVGSYLEFFVIARAAVTSPKEKAIDKRKSKARSNPRNSKT